jgi:hypothetical protein
MERDREAEPNRELDRLMERASASVRKSLDATIDVKARLRALLGDTTAPPGVTAGDDRP